MKTFLYGLIALQVLDFTTTVIGLHYGGHEADPLVIAILQSGGLVGMALSKIGVVIGLVMLAWWAQQDKLAAKVTTYLFGFTAIVYVGIVAWNVYNVSMLMGVIQIR